MATYSSEAWARLAHLLITRRVELGHRDRSAFCRATGLVYKTVTEVELAKRTNFGPQMLAQFEMAYQWEPGSIERVLKGGDPVPLRPKDAGEQTPLYADYVGDDPLYRYIADYPGDDASPLEIRTAIMAIRDLREARASATRGGGEVTPLRQADTG